MYVFHIRFSKKHIAFCLALAVMAIGAAMLLGGCLSKEPATQTITVSSNEDRIAFFQERGWEVDAEPIETLDLQLPEDLSADYSDYCKLQSSQGLPFDQYGGRQVTRYTYVITNYPDMPSGVQGNLYVCDERVIAGDIIATGEGGFQQGLTFPKK